MKEFEVKIAGLSPGHHTFTLPVTDAFFAHYPESLVQRGNLQAMVDLEKSETMVIARFLIQGEVELISDRTLEPFMEPIRAQEQIVYKFGEVAEEVSDELVIVPWTAVYLDVSQPIYEFITLAIPQRKVEPELRGKDDPQADIELIYKSEADEPEGEEGDDKSTDPRWAELKRLFNN